MRVKITLECTECKQRNYDTTKEKRNHPDRMETKKYCRFCRSTHIAQRDEIIVSRVNGKGMRLNDGKFWRVKKK